MDEDLMDAKQFSSVVETLVKDSGKAQFEWAQEHKVHPAEISNTIAGRTPPGRKLLEVLGFEKVVLYRKKAAVQEPVAEGAK